MKFKHMIGIIALLIIVVAGVLIYKGLGRLDQIIEAGIEKYGSEILQAPVMLDAVELDLAAGMAALKGLQIGNPQGFTTDYSVKLDEVRVTVDVSSLTSAPVIVSEVLIEGPAVTYEVAAGGSNIDTLAENAARYGGAGDENDDSGGPKLVITDLYIKNGQVSVSHSALEGKTLTAPLPNIHLEDIGKAKGGATPGEVAGKIMTRLRSGAGSAVATLKLDGILDGAGGVLGNAGKKASSLLGKGKDGLGKTAEKLKGLFD